MNDKKLAKFLIVLLLLPLTLAYFSGDKFRYPCQDPTNWETPECKPPVCSAAGTCPVDLVGEDVFNGTTTTQTTPEGGTNE